MNNWGLIVGLGPMGAFFAGDGLSVKDAGRQTDSNEQRCQRRKYALPSRPSPESHYPVPQPINLKKKQKRFILVSFNPLQ
jgi:hypothetical protein